MIYDKILPAVFLSRPNRFIATIQLDSGPEICHVKNTGRCRELLVPGAKIFVQDCLSPTRKTRYDLISVWKGSRLINMDSAAPNKIFYDYIRTGGIFKDFSLIKPECRFGDSRFDFYIEAAGKHIFAEVKGVTLEDDGVVRFPDAPTERGIKHLNGLCDCVAQGFEAWAVFIIQMSGVRYFEPNRETHPAFADALLRARAAGVNILALDCEVTETSITAGIPVTIHL